MIECIFMSSVQKERARTLRGKLLVPRTELLRLLKME
jgi:hypothetical protein